MSLSEVDQKKRKIITEYLSEHPGSSKRAIIRGVEGKLASASVQRAVKSMVEDGSITVTMEKVKQTERATPQMCHLLWLSIGPETTQEEEKEDEE